MESSVSGILAKLKLRKIKEVIKIKFKNKIKIWLRHGNDVFAFHDKDTIETRILE